MYSSTYYSSSHPQHLSFYLYLYLSLALVLTEVLG